MEEKRLKWIYWTPRIICILLAIFITMFAFDEPFFSVNFLMHMIPTGILVVFTLIAWKFELVGGVLFIILGIIWTFFFMTFQDMITSLLISFPVIIVGILFLWDYFLHKEKK